jgi:hypothetical protein
MRGGKLIDMAEQALGVGWWTPNNRVNTKRLNQLMRRENLSCDVVYVSIANESEAARAASLAEHLGKPYLVHMMDLCHDEGINPRTMPGYCRLIAQAGSVFCLSEAMLKEVGKIRQDHVEIVRFGQQPLLRIARPPRKDGPVRLLIVGSLGSADNPALSMLETALPNLMNQCPRLECLYLGQHYQLFSPSLKKLVRYPGRLSEEDYNNQLTECHLAFLPSSSRLDCYGIFSLPSRLADYFFAGLPVLAAVAAGSAVEGLLEKLSDRSVILTRSSEQFVEGAKSFMDPVRWQEASLAAIQFARDNFDIGSIRSTVLDRLRHIVEKTKTDS